MSRAELEQWQSRGRYLDYRGYPVFLREAGSGEALLCLHGYPYSGWHWRVLWPALAAQYRVIAPDMLGCGFSAKPRDFNYTIPAQADLMVALLRQLGIADVHLLAHDYGVSIAQELLARNLEGADAPRVRSVCFLNGGLLPEKFRERMEHRLIRLRGMQVALLFDGSAFARSVGALFGADTRPTADALALDWELATRDGGLFVADRIFHFLEERIDNRERWVGALQGTPAALRLVSGAADPIAGQAMADTYREVVPQADVVSLPGIGHFPHLEAPDAVVAAFHAFQAGIGSRARA